MSQPNEARRMQAGLRKLCRELNLPYFKGGIDTDVVGNGLSGERIPELIGYFCTRGLTLHPGVLPHLADLILKLVTWGLHEVQSTIQVCLHAHPWLCH